MENKNIKDNIDIGLEIGLTASAYRAAGIKVLKVNKIDDITREQFGILILLSITGGVSQTQIANMLGKDRPNITRMIDILEKKGLIRREKDENNRRILKVYLTDEGFKKAELARPLKERIDKIQSKALTQEEVQVLGKLLKKVRNSIAKEYNLEI